MTTATFQKIVLGLLIVLSTIIDVSDAIKCYSCKNTCSGFNQTSAFEIDCGNSTMCLKTIHPYVLTNGERIESIERRCAAQQDDRLVLGNGGWVSTGSIMEMEEGCKRLKKGSDTIYCHCRGDRCNAGRSLSAESSAYHTDAMAVIFVFNVMKYVRNMAD